MKLDSDSATTKSASELAIGQLRLSAGLWLAAVIVNVVGNVASSLMFGTHPGSPAARLFGLFVAVALDVGFIFVIAWRVITPTRRTAAIAVGTLAAVLDVATALLPSRTTMDIIPWIDCAEMLLFVAAWGLARRRFPLWVVGLVPALIVQIGRRYLLDDLNAAQWFSGVIGRYGSAVVWPVSWWVQIAIGCLACWAFDAVADSFQSAEHAPTSSISTASPSQAAVGSVSADHRRYGTNAMAIAALVSSLVLAPLGIVFGHIALNQIKRSGEDGRGLAIAGLAIGYVSCAMFLLWVCLAMVTLA